MVESGSVSATATPSSPDPPAVTVPDSVELRLLAVTRSVQLSVPVVPAMVAVTVSARLSPEARFAAGANPRVALPSWLSWKVP